MFLSSYIHHSDSVVLKTPQVIWKRFKLGASGALTLPSPVLCGIYTPFSNEVTGLSSLFAIYSEIDHLSPRDEADALHYII